MSRTIGILTIVLLSGGEAFGAGWPTWLTFRSQPAPTQPAFMHHNCSCDDSPLRPEVSHWTFARSNCKQSACPKGLGGLFHCEAADVQIYPALPYGHGPSTHATAPAPPPPASPPAPATPPPDASPSPSTPDSMD